MSDQGGQLGGLVYGFTGASLLLWLGVAALPHATVVARWFRARMLTAPGIPPLGRKDAANNMVPGQIVTASIAGIVIGTVIIWNAGGKIAAELTSADVQVLPALLAINLGVAGVVAGATVGIRGSSGRTRRSRILRAGGAVAGVVGLVCVIGGIMTVLRAG